MFAVLAYGNSVPAVQISSLPVTFEAISSSGADSGIRFMSRGAGGTLLFARDQVHVDLPSNADDRFRRVTMQFVGSRGTAEPKGESAVSTKSHYYFGSDSTRWIRDAAHFSKLRYSNLYPGVDLVFYGNPTKLEYDWIVAPGQDPGVIHLRIQGANSVRLDRGALLVSAGGGRDLVCQLPEVYQVIDGERRPVTGGYVLRGQEVGFNIGPYDRTHELVIDPVLSWLSYLGGTGDDAGADIKIDSKGRAVLLLSVASTKFNFPVGGGLVDKSGKGSVAAVIRLNQAGTAIDDYVFLGKGVKTGVYGNPYFGGAVVAAFDSTAVGLSLDASDNVYLTGFTKDPDFPLLNASRVKLSGEEVFVSKLDSKLNLVYSTFFGGSGDDEATSIAVDATGSAWIAGTTHSSDFPLLKPIRTVSAAPAYANTGFVFKLGPDGQPQFSTLWGNYGATRIVVRLDSSSSAYVSVAYQDPEIGVWFNQYASLGKINPDFTLAYFKLLSSLAAEFMASSTGQEIGDFAIDSKDRIYIPVSPAISGQIFSYVYDLRVFVTDSNLASITKLSTGINRGEPHRILVDQSGNIYLLGVGKSGTALQSPFQSTGTDSNTFLTKVDPSGKVIWSSYLGGNSSDFPRGMAVDSAGAFYFIGTTSSSDFPAIGGAGQQAIGGGTDAYFGKIEDSSAACVFGANPPNATGSETGGTLSLRVTVNRDGCAWNITTSDSWIIPTPPVSGSLNGSLSYRLEGNFGQPRTGYILANGQRIQTIYQGSPQCTPTLDTSTRFFGYQGGQASASLVEASTCAWSATADVPWISLNCGSSAGKGSATCQINVSPNPGAPRAGNAQIAGRTVAVQQGGADGARTPVFAPEGVVNAASYAGGGVSPGEMVSIFGRGVGPDVLAPLQLVNGKISTQAGNTSVYFDGVPAPVIYAQAGTASVIVPYVVATPSSSSSSVPRTSTNIELVYNGVSAPVVTIPVKPSLIGLFSANGSGTGQGAFLNEDLSPNNQTNPAHPGSIVVFYATGEGQTNPGGVDGQIAGAQLPKPILPVSVTIGGNPAQQVYAGAAPQSVAGLMQINVRVPDNTPSGDIPVQVQVGGAQSQAGLTLAVEAKN
jgi:uncharacterized protein (TIGR03437 family)